LQYKFSHTTEHIYSCIIPFKKKDINICSVTTEFITLIMSLTASYSGGSGFDARSLTGNLHKIL